MSNPLMIANPQKDSNVEIIQKHIFYLRFKSTFTLLKQSNTTHHTKPFVLLSWLFLQFTYVDSHRPWHLNFLNNIHTCTADLHRLTGPIMSKSCKSNFIYIYMSSPS
jgi:hypothetical protein